MALLAIASVAFAMAAGSPADVLHLTCSGRVREDRVGRSTVRPWRDRLDIDLAQSRYRFAGKPWQRIADIRPPVVVLRQDADPTGDNYSGATYDLEEHHLSGLDGGLLGNVSLEATCRPRRD